MSISMSQPTSNNANAASNNANANEIYPTSRINDPHVPVILLCDISGSMEGLPLENLVKGIHKFRDDICRNHKLAETVDVCVMAFNQDVEIVQGWRPLAQMEDVKFEAYGCTAMGQALEFAVEELKKRGHDMERNGIKVRMPQLVLITDGYATESIDEVAETIHARTAAKKMQLWVLGLAGYNMENIYKLTGGKRALELLDDESYDFSDFFSMFSDVVKAVSASAPGERIHIASPLEKPGVNLKAPNWDAFLND